MRVPGAKQGRGAMLEQTGAGWGWGTSIFPSELRGASLGSDEPHFLAQRAWPLFCGQEPALPSSGPK